MIQNVVALPDEHDHAWDLAGSDSVSGSLVDGGKVGPLGRGEHRGEREERQDCQQKADDTAHISDRSTGLLYLSWQSRQCAILRDRMQSRHRVFVTGAAGFVGRAVVQALRADGHAVRCLVRRGSEHDLRGFEAIERVEGDVRSRHTLEDDIAGCDTVIHLVGIIREAPARGVTFDRVHVDGTMNVLDVARAAGVRRMIHMSALGTRSGARSRYHETKWAAEEAVRSSPLPWTIFRPSIIYGRGDGFISMLGGMIRRLPVIPVIGDGQQRLQPIPVEQVAEAFARAVTQPDTAKQTFELGGPNIVTMLTLIDMVAAAIGKRRLVKVHVPLGVVRTAARLFHRLPAFPLTPDQLSMLEENSTCDPEPFYSAFGIVPLPLANGLRRMFS